MNIFTVNATVKQLGHLALSSANVVEILKILLAECYYVFHIVSHI